MSIQSKEFRKKTVVDKSLCQKWHAQKRFKERFGFKLTDELYNMIVACIKKNKTDNNIKVTWKEKQSNKFSVYRVEMGNNFPPFDVVYDVARKTVVTFLFPEKEQLITHYYDIFGNKVHTKSTTGSYWRYNPETKKLIIPNEDVTSLGENKWITGTNLREMILEYKEDGYLYEMMN